MNMFSVALVCGSVALVSGLATTADTEPCCQGDCTEKKNQKYYSLVTHTCEEACFPFEEYDTMLALNPNLVPSHTLYPCHSHGYTEYIETPTVDNTLTMDVYTLPAKADMVKRCETCSVTGEEKFYFIYQEWTETGPWNCGESCLRPEDYASHRVRQPKLLPSNSSSSSSNTPCLDSGFDVYLHTETRGKGEVQTAVDVYTKDQ